MSQLSLMMMPNRRRASDQLTYEQVKRIQRLRAGLVESAKKTEEVKKELEKPTYLARMFPRLLRARF
jgi:hypothetical protein